jgi:hypothetical protein
MAALVDRAGFAGNLEGYLNDLEVLRRRLEEWIAEAPGFPYESYARAELERALAEAARLFFANRLVLPEGAARGIELTRQLIAANEASCRYYETLAAGREMYEKSGARPGCPGNPTPGVCAGSRERGRRISRRHASIPTGGPGRGQPVKPKDRTGCGAGRL